MKRIADFILKIQFFSFGFFCLLGQPLYAAKNKKKASVEAPKHVTEIRDPVEVQDVEIPEEQNEVSTENSVKLVTKKPTYFSKIDSEIVLAVENGSPESIKQAMQKIRKGESDYTEAEKVLINISTEIMKTVWPSEKITWDAPELSEENSYTGAIASANKGVFDSSTGNTDFLSTILPAIIIFKPFSDDSIYESCEIAITEALSKNSNSVLANYMLGCVYEKKGDVNKALELYKLAYESSTLSQETVLAYSRVLRLTGNLEEATKILATVSSGSTDIKILKQNAYLAFATGDYTSAEEYVGRVLQQNPNDLEFVLFRAKILVEKKDYIHAVSLLDVYARQDSTSLDYLLLRSKVQLDWSKNTSAATENIEKALQLYPENTEALMFAARISSTIDSPVAGKYADELAAKVLEKDPGNKEAMLYALNGLIQRENWEDAYKISSELILNTKISSEIIEKHVQLCVLLNKSQEGFDFAKKMLALYPDDEVVQQSYIYSYCQTGSRDSVIKYIDSQIAVATSSRMKSYLYYRRSFLQFSEDASLADLRSSLISNPRNSDALFRLYEIYYAKSDYRKAQYYLRQVVAINPNDNSVRQLNEALTKLIQ